jgi:hypothetical protein
MHGNIIKKLKRLQMMFESVANNGKFKHDDPETQYVGELRLCDRFATEIAEIIKELNENNTTKPELDRNQTNKVE